MSSARKRKAADAKATLMTVRETCLQLKPLLHDPSLLSTPSSKASASLLALLRNLASTASDLSALLQQGRESLNPRDQDELDAEGVGIWNRSAEFRERGLGELFARARAAAYSLMECGREESPGVDGYVRLIALGSKAALALSSAGDAQDAEGLLMKCASNEAALSKLPASHTSGEQLQRAKAQTTYFRVRAENAFHRKMLEPAWFMMRQACDDFRLSLLTPREVQPLMAFAHEVGSSLLASSGGAGADGPTQDAAAVKRAGVAVEWLTLGLRLSERFDREGGERERERRAYSLAKIRKNTMLSLARAYTAASASDKDNLERAEVTLAEILSNPELELEAADLRRARWLKLQCAFERKASEGQIVEAFTSIIENDDISGALVSRVIKTVLHGRVSPSRPSTAKILQVLLRRVLGARPSSGADEDPVDLLVTVTMSILIHLKAEESVLVVCRELRSAFDAIAGQNALMLSPSGCKACQLILWQMGDARFGATPPKHADAIQFYDLSLHPALQATKQDASMVHRKVTLCHILLQDYDRAAESVQKCDPDQAATAYLRLLSFVNQGLEEQAVAAVKALVASDDLDTQLLLLATRIATEASMPAVLLAVLEALLSRFQDGSTDILPSSGLVLARCLIRLTVQQLERAHTDQETDDLSESLVRHFHTALSLADTQRAPDADPPDDKELLWLYKQSYNLAVDGTRAAWADRVVYSLFELSIVFMSLYDDASLAPSNDIPLHRVLAAYASCVARYLELQAIEDDETRAKLLVVALQRTETFFNVLRPMLDREPPLDGAPTLQESSQTVRVLRVSCFLEARDWAGAERAVEDGVARASECSEAMFECVAQLVWSHPACPAEIATRILDRLLNASLDLDLIPSLDRFSRWMRTCITLLLAENTPASVAKALEHVNEAVDVHRAHASSDSMAYPRDESDWLIAICATEAQKDVATANDARAKQWFEAALALLPHCSWGEGKAQKLRQRYGDLLARLPSGGGGAI